MNKKRSLFFDTSLIYFVVILSFVSVRILSSLVSLKDWHANLLSLIIQVGIMLFIPFLMYKLMRKKNTKEVLLDFHVKKINIKAILFAIGIGVVVYFLNIAVANFFDIFIYNTGYDPSFGMASATGGIYTWQMFVSDIILSAILPGICEEFCHRGLLLNGYKQLGAKKTILLVGFIFGLMHLNIEQFFWLIIKTGGLILLIMWIRATYPRFKIDKTLEFCWHILIPVALFNLLTICIVRGLL